MKRREQFASQRGGCLRVPESGTRRREQLAVDDFRHQMVGHFEQILIRRAAFESLRSFHNRRITLLSCVRDLTTGPRRATYRSVDGGKTFSFVSVI
jgi:hypothetical protein